MRSSLGSRALAQQAAPRHGGGLGGCWGGAELFGVTFWTVGQFGGYFLATKEMSMGVTWSGPVQLLPRAIRWRNEPRLAARYRSRSRFMGCCRWSLHQKLLIRS